MTTAGPSPLGAKPPRTGSAAHVACLRLREYLNSQIIGQASLVERLLVALLADGHLLVEGPPGLAKTRAVKALAHGLDADFQRLQFTPDLLPADLTGSDIYRPEEGVFRFQRGPLFHNLILADEVNRAPAKVQSALLEAMAEGQISVGAATYPLPQLFLVMATQNPIEQEGTYPLPEAQLDRFMFNINVGYPSEEEEFQIVRLTTMGRTIQLQEVLGGEEVIALQEIVRKVPVADHVIRYALQFSRLTRRTEGNCPDFVNDYVGWGAGPRASQYLILAGKARALLKGRYHVSTEDIRQVALPVLRHRIVTNFNAEAEGIKSDTIVKKLIDFIPRQQYDELDKTTAKLMRSTGAA